MTTDPASHLQDIFGQEINHEPSRIQDIDNLFAARIDQRQALEEYKARILAAVKDQSEETKRSVEEDLNSPCAEEMAAFEKFMSYFEGNGYDITVFDTAPTGHTIRLLEMPVDWSQFISGSVGAGIMFTDTANQLLYAFDGAAGNPTGALVANTTAKTIELLPVTASYPVSSFNGAFDVTWSGAVVTYANTTPIYEMQGSMPTGLWILAELPPSVTVTTEN